MTADVITVYAHTAWCDECGWKSLTVNTVEAATRLAQDHNVLKHGGGEARHEHL